MGCDYYIQNVLVIDYQDKNGRIHTIYTNKSVEKGYLLNSYDYDSDDDEETSYKKYEAELERIIKKNQYDKMLFENGEWVKKSYKMNYEARLMETYKDIVKIVKVYKKYSAWVRL
jgi:hypothetical protein